MPQIRKIITAGVTFSVALGIGFVMQNGDVLAARFGTEAQPVAPATIQVAVVKNDVTVFATTSRPAQGPSIAPPAVETALAGAVVFPEVTDAPNFDATPIQLASAEITPGFLPATLVDAARTTASADCRTVLTATADPAAMVGLSLSSPCNPNARVTLHHQGMMFTVRTDEDGTAFVDVPALAEVSVFIAAFENGDGAVATLMVPDVQDFDRAVLLSQGYAGLQIHALEFGASYGQEGHVWQSAARDASVSFAGQGFLVSLGSNEVENPMYAEVYSFPRNMADTAGSIALSVEAEITLDNCGHEISAQSIQIVPGHDNSAIDLTMTMPSCAAVGDFLVLSDMLEDLTLASR